MHLYPTHGSPLKSVHDYYFCDPTTDWALSQPRFFDAVNSYEFHIPLEKLVTLGFPRNDDLFTHKCDLKDIFGAEFDRFLSGIPRTGSTRTASSRRRLSPSPSSMTRRRPQP